MFSFLFGFGNRVRREGNGNSVSYDRISQTVQTFVAKVIMFIFLKTQSLSETNCDYITVIAIIIQVEIKCVLVCRTTARGGTSNIKYKRGWGGVGNDYNVSLRKFTGWKKSSSN